MTILTKLSERLGELMKGAGINIPALACRTGLNASVVSRILNKERMPSRKTLIVIADFFGCSADYLTGLSDNWDEKEFKKCPPFDERFDYLLKYFGVSKYKLEKQTGISEETVNRWHSGKYEPTVENLIKLSTFFDCSLDFILGREN